MQSDMNMKMSFSSDIFMEEVLKLATDIVWKDQTAANRAELDQFRIDVDTFIAANRGVLNFDLVPQFTYTSLIAAKLTETQALQGTENKFTIPISERENCVKQFVAELLLVDPVTDKHVNYKEYNNYYRMLNGLPDLDDTDYIYNTKYNRYPRDIPIHELRLSERYELEALGYFDELAAQYPTKKYIKYLGQKCINFYKARSATRFDILWMNSSDKGTLEPDFVDIYDQNKYMVTSVYYNTAYLKSNELYDNFLAMAILFMSIQMMSYKYLAVDITRDFYDTESLKYVYDTYGVPFYPSIPLKYHQRIVKNINKLLSYKGSTQVFFDLFDLFDMGTMDIYAYYLAKSRKFDESGIPLFLRDEHGELDDHQNYDVYFSKVKLYNDPALEIADPSNRVEYSTLTAVDPYWQSDAELMNKLFDSKYNYTESKYIGIQTVFDINKITYEYAYFFKILEDNRQYTDLMVIDWNVVPNKVSLYDLFIYLACLYCKKYGYQGRISTEFPFVAKVLGFNFKENLTVLVEKMRTDKYFKNQTQLISLIRGINVNSLSSVNSALVNILEIQTLLSRLMMEATERQEYYAYRNLYNTLLTSKLLEEAFRNVDGTMPEDFYEVLKDTSVDLLNRYHTIENEKLADEIKEVISVLNKSIPTLRYLETSVGFDTNSMVDSLFKILAFFKSAKAELVGYNIIYLLSSRGDNYFKLMDVLHDGLSISHFRDSDLIDDYMKAYRLRAYLRNKKDLALKDVMITKTAIVFIEDQINKLTDYLHSVYSVSKLNPDNFPLEDYIHRASLSAMIGDLLEMRDETLLTHELISYQEIKTKIRDEFSQFSDELFVDDGNSHTLLESVLTAIDRVISIGETINEALQMNDSNLLTDRFYSELKMFNLPKELQTYLVREIIHHLRSSTRDAMPINDQILFKIGVALMVDELTLSDRFKENYIVTVNRSTMLSIDRLASDLLEKTIGDRSLVFTDKVLTLLTENLSNVETPIIDLIDFIMDSNHSSSVYGSYAVMQDELITISIEPVE